MDVLSARPSDESMHVAQLWEELAVIEHGMEDPSSLKRCPKMPPVDSVTNSLDELYDPIHLYNPG